MTYWKQEGVDLSAVQALTPATENSLLTVLQHILTDTGEINVGHQDVWEVLSGATALQFGMATGEGHSRAEVTCQQLLTSSTMLGDGSLPAHRMLLAIQSGMSAELEMDELTQILEYLMDQTGRQAEVVFGHGLEPALGEGVRLLLLISR
ncbi:hypothetical protein GCM10023186_45940 [Hymenobacter koreensis]|uniref:Tubulin/FtsZ 2-layer sandwich domain-containing protein n=2 Tax=Hymenobacter koreensis TaxID=1084523 RepID=A0ABP8JP53_9BACT